MNVCELDTVCNQFIINHHISDDSLMNKDQNISYAISID